MAAQIPVSLQSIIAVTNELWPSMTSVFSAPWKGLQQPKTTTRSRPVSRQPAELAGGLTRAEENVGLINSEVTLPDFLRLVPVASLSSSSRYPVEPSSRIQNTLLSLPPNALWAFSPLARRMMPAGRAMTRQYSTLPQFGLHQFRAAQKTIGFEGIQRRTFLSGSSSRNLLAHMEQTANNNPQSATAQNAFYQALLRANMPEIVVERYQTGRFASNAACESAYVRALEKVGQADKAIATSGGTKMMEGQAGSLSPEQLRAVGQAVAAQSHGGNIALSRNKDGSMGTGAKESPLYVVVEESVANTLFRWFKFMVYFGLCFWFFLMLMTMGVEATGALKKVGSAQNTEAQPQHQTVRFSDVHGCDEAKEELQELVEFLKNPDKFSSLGGKLPKGVLLTGPPGTGKTLLARAVAGEAGVPFFFMSGSEFDEVYVGVGAKRVRELFNAARAKAPAIVFIDELDAIGGKRNARDAAYVKQTLNQLLVDLDGFSQNSGVVFLAATNFPQLLDKALTRPGRFDRNIVVGLPDVRGRVEILKHHMKNVQIGPDVDPTVIARGTPGFSGAELENVVNQAAVRASRSKAKKVTMMDFEWARDKILLGAERRSAVIQQKDKVMTAYHEGGHALVAMFTAGADPLYKATIMPRGNALGITFQLPEMDRVSMAKSEYLALIDVCMGGKVAEEMVYGPDKVTSGAASDLQRATSIAYSMVTQMGMSEELGNVDLNSNYDRLSSETKQHIEKEVRRLVEEGRERATKLLQSKRKELDLLAQALVEYESLNKDEMERVVKGEKLPDRLSSLAAAPIKLPETLLPPGLGGNGLSSTPDSNTPSNNGPPRPGDADL